MLKLKKGSPVLDRGSDYFSVCVFFHFANNGAKNISEQTSLPPDAAVSEGSVTTSGIRWSTCTYMLHFSTHSQVPFCRCSESHAHRQLMRPPSSQHLCQYWCVSVFSIFASLLAKRCLLVVVVWTCISLTITEADRLFIHILY